MKLRTGFVSNSSSSSFIVAIPKRIKTSKDLQKLLFGDERFYPNPYAGNDAHSPWGWPIEEVVSVVYKDFIQAQILSEVDIMVMSDDIANPVGREKIRVMSFIRENPDCNFCLFRYSDEDGTFRSALEHGPLFSRVPHIAINNH